MVEFTVGAVCCCCFHARGAFIFVAFCWDIKKVGRSQLTMTHTHTHTLVCTHTYALGRAAERRVDWTRICGCEYVNMRSGKRSSDEDADVRRAGTAEIHFFECRGWHWLSICRFTNEFVRRLRRRQRSGQRASDKCGDTDTDTPTDWHKHTNTHAHAGWVTFGSLSLALPLALAPSLFHSFALAPGRVWESALLELAFVTLSSMGH